MSLRYYATEALQNMERFQILDEWGELCRLPESSPLGLECGAMLIAYIINGSVDRECVKDNLIILEKEILAQLGCFADSTPHKIQALHEVLFSVHSFQGNDVQYFKKENHSIDALLENEVGSPALLSLLYTLLGRRIGLVVDLISLPHYFLVKVSNMSRYDETGLEDKFQGMERYVFVDPFRRGKIMTQADCEEMVEKFDVKFENIFLKKVGNIEVWCGILKNLCYLFRRQGSIEPMVKCIESLLCIAPECTSELFLYAQTMINSPHMLEEVIDTIGHLIDLNCSHNLPLGMLRQMKQLALEKIAEADKQYAQHMKVRRRSAFAIPPKFEIGMVVKVGDRVGVIKNWDCQNIETESEVIDNTESCGQISAVDRSRLSSAKERDTAMDGIQEGGRDKEEDQDAEKEVEKEVEKAVEKEVEQEVEKEIEIEGGGEEILEKENEEGNDFKEMPPTYISEDNDDRTAQEEEAGKERCSTPQQEIFEYLVAFECGSETIQEGRKHAGALTF